MRCATCRWCAHRHNGHDAWQACDHPAAPVTFIPAPAEFGCTLHQPEPGQLDLWSAA